MKNQMALECPDGRKRWWASGRLGRSSHPGAQRGFLLARKTRQLLAGGLSSLCQTLDIQK
jgi:hypothetical protein